MREILFRGKEKLTGVWRYGSLLKYPNAATIKQIYGDRVFHTATYEIIPETVGQFTGLTDKNGTKIFEGDIIRDADGDVMIVKWLTEGATFVLEPKPYVSVHFYSTLPSEIEVIGNIHDNSELLTE